MRIAMLAIPAFRCFTLCAATIQQNENQYASITKHTQPATDVVLNVEGMTTMVPNLCFCVSEHGSYY